LHSKQGRKNLKLDFYKDRLKGMLNHKRYEHSLGVMNTAMQLATVHGADAEQAALAGLLHDCARCIPEDRLVEMAREFDLSLHEVDLALPVLLHAPVGGRLARRDFGVQDEAVLRAIAVHTLGDKYMTLLDKVLFIADKVEPGRHFQAVDKLRALAKQDLDRALLSCYDMSINYALRLGDQVHPQMITARNKLILDKLSRKI